MKSAETKRANNTANGCAMIFIILAVIGFAAAIYFGTKSNQTPQQTEKPTKLVAADKAFYQACDVTEDQAKAITAAFKACQVQQGAVLEVRRDEMLDDLPADGATGYRVELTRPWGVTVILYLDGDKAVYSIRYADVDYYLGGVGAILPIPQK